MKLLPLIAIAAAGCARPHYLGAPVPEPCTTRDVEGCLGWMMERDLVAAELGIYDDPELRRYVQRVADRLARVASIDAAPRVVITDQDETYATAGRRIVVARTTIERLGSEAELAGVIAHELAHLEGRHVMVSLFGRPAGGETPADKRDDEAIADERAVWLLERAGYAPAAMPRALDAVLEAEDEDHPPRADRIARVARLAGGRSGFEGRDELLRALDRMVVGRDPRLGRRVGDAWVVPVLGLALALDGDHDELHSTGALLALRRGRAAMVAYAIGAPWARELGATLDGRDATSTALGRVTTGDVPSAAAARADDSPLGKLARAIRTTLPQPIAGTHVAIVERPHGALVIELGAEEPDGERSSAGPRDAKDRRRGPPRLGLRAATAAELAAAAPARIAIERATAAGPIARVDACPGRLLDDPARTVAIGDPIKCADRPIGPAAPRAGRTETRRGE